jgi:hypothetical protein
MLHAILLCMNVLAKSGKVEMGWKTTSVRLEHALAARCAFTCCF